MDRKLFFKILAIVGLTILLLIPLALVEGQIRERSQRQEEVQRNIANSAAGPQTLTGPVILLRTREHVTEARRDADSNLPVTTTKIVVHSQLIAPETLSINGYTKVETRKRGIYQARLFHLDATSQSRFAVNVPAAEANDRLIDAEAVLLLGLSDPRGVDNDPEVMINGQRHRFGTGAQAAEALPMAQLSVPLGRLELGKTHRFEVSFPLQLTGTTRLSIAPTGETNSIQLKSAWPHPNFGGRFLPRERSVSADGFAARWEISHLARDFTSALQPSSGEALSVDFVDPVNIYLQSERAVKYGVLFIVLTFAGFFLTEILRRAPIHPLQYLLVGLALAIFFLLLIAFSEHMAFAAAYGLAAGACIGLIAWYLAGALGDWRRGAAFGAGLTGLYGVLYGVLLSEDNALLMGSLLLFIALGVVMLTTRRLDWYGLGQRPPERAR
ncbi:MAG: cell envelope integrity protein CreD [Azonexus sp.]|uniref:cell envelope integrity protein CreD n=1 Tax=Azonexus sp. TaxID=1872668 RepID=UPI00281E8397|nr:cell envelope integrity protein CreD [Azonexus sp.]MDR0775436.1 cell envelope integrity protein CreD [Azonexus sp.]